MSNCSTWSSKLFFFIDKVIAFEVRVVIWCFLELGAFLLFNGEATVAASSWILCVKQDFWKPLDLIIAWVFHELFSILKWKLPKKFGRSNRDWYRHDFLACSIACFDAVDQAIFVVAFFWCTLDVLICKLMLSCLCINWYSSFAVEYVTQCSLFDLALLFELKFASRIVRVGAITKFKRKCYRTIINSAFIYLDIVHVNDARPPLILIVAFNLYVLHIKHHIFGIL